MNQLYFSSNIQTGYIKSILKNVALPIYDVVNPGDYIIKNFYYILLGIKSAFFYT